MRPYIYLDVLAASDLNELLLALKRLLHAVVGHAEETKSGLERIATPGEDDELGEERDGDRLAVDVVCQLAEVRRVVAAHQPEPLQRRQNRRTDQNAAE